MTRVLLCDGMGEYLPEEYQPSWLDISGGHDHTIALTTDGRLFGMGNPLRGRLLNNYLNIVDSRLILSNLSNVDWIHYFGPLSLDIGNISIQKVIASNEWSAILTTDGYIYSWGNNDHQRLGRGGPSIPPAKIDTNNTFRHMYLNNAPCGLAIDTRGDLWSWGNNHNGQLGRGALQTGSFPIERVREGVNGKGEIVQFPIITETDTPGFHLSREWLYSAMTGAFSLAIDADGRMWAWGLNQGNLGLGDLVTRLVPHEITAGPETWDEDIFLNLQNPEN
jgi:alpha-tubulin suppressor-like RCC1 family protein